MFNIGLGNQEEAVRCIANSRHNAPGAEYVVSNALVGLVNIGHFSGAHKLAHEAARRFAGNPTILRQVSHVFARTLDFSAAAESVDGQLKFNPEAAFASAWAAKKALWEAL